MIRNSLLALATTTLVWTIASPAVHAQTDDGLMNVVEPIILVQGPGSLGDEEDDGGAPRWLQELNLSSDQVQRMQAVRDRYRPQLQAQRQQLETAMKKMKDLMTSDASADQIRQQHNQLESLHKTISDLRFESMLAIRDILTPAQRQQAADLMQQHREQFRQRLGDRPGQRLGNRRNGGGNGQ
jgi:Spy/CpxP family protein refolding chaperone